MIVENLGNTTDALGATYNLMGKTINSMVKFRLKKDAEVSPLNAEQIAEHMALADAMKVALVDSFDKALAVYDMTEPIPEPREDQTKPAVTED